jgi:hypothetical protein
MKELEQTSMAWRWQSTCSGCEFVSAQLGSQTPCPSHAGQWRAARELPECVFEDDAPMPSANQPWPFTPHEYARLLILRSRFRDQRDAA